MRSQVTSAVLVGVGGQGVLLAAKITAEAAMLAGFVVKTNEVHGMAQRGGSVIAQVSYGPTVYSPLVPRGTARALCSLEQIEALRYHDYLAPEGLAVVSSQAILPVTVSAGAARYPDRIEEILQEVFPRLVYLDAPSMAARLGNARAANMVLLGSLSKGLDLPLEAWLQSLCSIIRDEERELNLSAFQLGRSIDHEPKG
jgi:indolepyruvate ferredoxin oxidoreductase beta subunit